MEFDVGDNCIFLVWPSWCLITYQDLHRIFLTYLKNIMIILYIYFCSSNKHFLTF